MNRGFTLIELLIVFGIIGILSTILLLNLRGGQEEAMLQRVAVRLESDMRKASNLAVASSIFQGIRPCGYGISYVDGRTYRIYAGQRGLAAECASSDHNFQLGTDLVFEEVKIIEERVVFRDSFPDIFFEPPDPAIYINNSRTAGFSTTLTVCLETDLNKCVSLVIDTAGRIIIQ